MLIGVSENIIEVYPMILSCKQNLFNHWDRTCLTMLTSLLDVIITEDQIKDMNKTLKAFEWTFNQLDDVEKISRLCIYVAYVSRKRLILFQIEISLFS